MTTMLTDRIDTGQIETGQIDTGDVIEIERDGEATTTLVLLATDTAVILDACDGTTPFVVRRDELTGYRKYEPTI